MKNLSKIMFFIMVVSYSINAMQDHGSNSVSPSQQLPLTIEQEMKVADELNDRVEQDPSFNLKKLKAVNKFISDCLNKYLIDDLSKLVLDYDKIDNKYSCSASIQFSDFGALFHMFQLDNGSLIFSSWGGVEMWDIKDGSFNRLSALNSYKVYGTIALKDSTFASYTPNGDIIIWNLVNNKSNLLQTLQHSKSPVYNLTQLTNGSLASCGNDGNIKIWSLRDKEYFCSQILRNNTSSFSNIIQLQNGSLVSCSRYKKIYIWSLANNEYSLSQSLDCDEPVVKVIELQNGCLASLSPRGP